MTEKILSLGMRCRWLAMDVASHLDSGKNYQRLRTA
jgi:hypothetical protein